MDEETRKKFVGFENALDEIISEELDGVSEEDVEEYFGSAQDIVPQIKESIRMRQKFLEEE